ncbi:MAG: ParB/RepB/Spo0J family partition protein [Deltaproteobacteria bacterium]|nr:ParB/RepB/Spo0J family partition protein [Deltaproteobacteria bacterium]
MADVERKKQALGRGLGALIPGLEENAGAARGLLRVPIERLRPMTGGQPRQRFDESRLEELAASVREVGILSPLLVRAVSGGYEIIAGERRWRAAQRAGLLDVPVLVRERTGDDEAFELGLVENLQRDDLNAIEVAHSYRRLLEEFGYTQERLAKRVGKDRSTLANALRLLKLPERVQQMTASGELSEGHARALLSLEDAGAILEAAKKVVREGLSVRQAEALARRGSREKPGKAKPRESPAVRDLIERLQRALGARVQIQHRGGRGKLEVHFSSLEQLDAILKRLL